jgi:hypothetical protein
MQNSALTRVDIEAEEDMDLAHARRSSGSLHVVEASNGRRSAWVHSASSDASGATGIDPASGEI